MEYPVDSIYGPKYPKIIGSYEFELVPLLKSLLANKYNTIINIGSAEGYYAVGFAITNKISSIIAVDPLSKARDYLNKLAIANNVTPRIQFYRLVTARRMNKWINGRSLIFMDCEGAEVGLLNPHKCSKLHQADILVEVHEFVEEGISERIMARFSLTHKVTFIAQTNRAADNFDILKDIDKQIAEELMNEKRPANIHWLYFESKQYCSDQ